MADDKTKTTRQAPIVTKEQRTEKIRNVLETLLIPHADGTFSKVEVLEVKEINPSNDPVN
jgi:hypothetical protein